MVPIDRELIDVKYLDAVDIVRINEYHKRVYEVLSPHMEGDELEMLAAATEAF